MTDPAMPDAAVDSHEIEKFARLAEGWWDPDGAFKPLHRMNPIRLDYIRDHLCAQFGRDPRSVRPLTGLRLADIGCGGGLLCEPLARLGAAVTGIDAAAEAVEAARAHAAAMGLDIDYRATTAEALAESGETYDAVLAMEIVEHVPNISDFVVAAGALTAPGGLMILSTINRTPKSYALAIVGAEYVMRWLPRGTHDWNRFPTPHELRAALENAGLAVVDDTGFTYDPLHDRWRRSSDLSVNYALVAERAA